MPAIPRPNPELMVIGDSLAQGCRTLSVSEELCSQSYGHIIAKSQGWDFQYPRFPRPVLFDLDEEARHLSGLGILGGLRRLRRNVRDWERHFADQQAGDLPDAFDNLAVAGASIQQMTSFTAGEQRERLRDELFPKVVDKPLVELFDWLEPTHLAINASFVLNPTGAADLDGLDQLQWVELRRPKRLIAHFGHNDGLYPVGGSADTTDFFANLPQTLAAYKQVLERLAHLHADVQLIVVVLYPKLGAVANLDPVGPRDAHGYAQHYHTRFPLPGNDIRGTALRHVDEKVKAFNREVRLHAEDLPLAHRFRFVDAYRILGDYDYKNTGDESRQVVIGNKRIDNRYLQGRWRWSGPPHRPNRRRVYEFAYGGLQSLDGMHLSAVGYAVLACEIMRKLDMVFDENAVLRQAFQDEDLIRRYNANLKTLDYLLDTVEDLRPGERDKEELSYPTMLGAQQRIFTHRP
jgi:hypothetical protein